MNPKSYFSAPELLEEAPESFSKGDSRQTDPSSAEEKPQRLLEEGSYADEGPCDRLSKGEEPQGNEYSWTDPSA